MRVLAIDPEPSSFRGGQEKSLFDILVGLKGRGHDIILAYVTPGDYLDQYEEHGVRTIQIHTTKNEGFQLKSFYRLFLSTLKLRSLAKADVIYINEIVDLPIAALLTLMRPSLRLVCHFRLPPPEIPLFKNRKNVIGIAIGQVNQFIVANNNMLNAYIGAGIPKEKLSVIPNCFLMDKLKFRKSEKNDGLKVIGFLGRLAEPKGLHHLIDALAILNEGPKYHLLVGGMPKRKEHFEYERHIKEKIDKLGLNGKVEFVGHVSNTASFFSRINLLVFPSIVNESFGRVMVESIMADTPVIARKVGATSEILDDPEEKWIFSTTQELVDKIKYYFEVPGSYNLNNKQIFMEENFSISKVLPKIETVLKK
ncbi:glycosyltransferase family 4 protein [Fulvivirga ulvae]|uniref:glycosyltransferase family 4 protein n=1 Tax=Fulvivirga ulvae TaxID=2904245 RepID=UPI001F3DAC36|nr:glycosyltransferase family 4 protein [Fulvivirga ulvae]UII33372.1 glycosyltransferase family 4 protein [Fulvivirga ulvae]